MRNITNVLMEEHQNILRVIDRVLDECSQIENGKPADESFFNEVIHFIKKYADGFHHAKEEEILFKAMLENTDAMHCNPIPVMLYEHDAGREFVKGLETALDRNDQDQIIENARGYCQLLSNHIYKEDNVLYPMAEQALDEDQKIQVEKKYSSVHLTNFFAEDFQVFFGRLNKSN